MKRYFLILITIISFSACSLDDDAPNQHFEYVAVTEVEMPSEFILDETYQIKVSYVLPNGCYQFYNFDYVYQDTSRIVGTVAIVDDNAACTEEIREGEYIINVDVRQSEPYIFKFWKGSDNQGNDEYLIVEVPVI